MSPSIGALFGVFFILCVHVLFDGKLYVRVSSSFY